MSIVSAINEIVDYMGGTPSEDGTIIGALDALTDVVADSDIDRGRTIEEAIKLFGMYYTGNIPASGGIIVATGEEHGGTIYYRVAGGATQQVTIDEATPLRLELESSAIGRRVSILEARFYGMDEPSGNIEVYVNNEQVSEQMDIGFVITGSYDPDDELFVRVNKVKPLS